MRTTTTFDLHRVTRPPGARDGCAQLSIDDADAVLTIASSLGARDEEARGDRRGGPSRAWSWRHTCPNHSLTCFTTR